MSSGTVQKQSGSALVEFEGGVIDPNLGVDSSSSSCTSWRINVRRKRTLIKRGAAAGRRKEENLGGSVGCVCVWGGQQL